MTPKVLSLHSEILKRNCVKGVFLKTTNFFLNFSMRQNNAQKMSILTENRSVLKVIHFIHQSLLNSIFKANLHLTKDPDFHFYIWIITKRSLNFSFACFPKKSKKFFVISGSKNRRNKNNIIIKFDFFNSKLLHFLPSNFFFHLICLKNGELTHKFTITKKRVIEKISFFLLYIWRFGLECCSFLNVFDDDIEA